jgi:hypothetical protein
MIENNFETPYSVEAEEVFKGTRERGVRFELHTEA